MTTLCQVTLWLWLGLTPSCVLSETDASQCQYTSKTVGCEFLVTFEPESRTLTITGPTDQATWDFPLEAAGWRKFSWREGGRLGILEGWGWRRRT